MKLAKALDWIRVIAVNLALCALVLAAGEGVVRACSLAPDLISIDPGAKEGIFRYSPNPKLGYMFTPNFSTPVPAYDGSFFRTNSAGLRDRERSLAGPPGWRRIILLGDSVTSAIHTGVDFTVSRQLERALLARGRKIEVLNMGVIGYCTRAEVELLETVGLRYDPDLVILLFVENDYRDFNEDLERALEYARPAFAETLFKSSQLFRLLALATDAFHFRSELMPDYRIDKNKQAIGSDNVPHGLERLRRLARQHDFRVLIALWPDFRQDGIYDNDLAPAELRDPTDPRLTIERLAARYGFDVVRLSPAFRADWTARRARGERRDPRQLYTNGDGMHPLRTGTLVAARALLAEAEQRLPAAKRPPGGP